MDSEYSEGKRGKVHVTVAQMDTLSAFVGILNRSLSFEILPAYIRFCVTQAWQHEARDQRIEQYAK